jgi:hypothetical protein
VYHISAGKGKVILCTLTSAKQSRLDREDGKQCNGNKCNVVDDKCKIVVDDAKQYTTLDSISFVENQS